jgi:predicted transcriptional regulator
VVYAQGSTIQLLSNLHSMAKKKASPKKSPAKRGAGKPRPSERPVTPEKLEQIADMFLEGTPITRIAEAIGVTRQTIQYHLDATIRPIWQEKMRSTLADDLAKVGHIERIAWERFHVSQQPETRRQVKKALVDEGADPQVVEKVITKITKTGEVAWLQVAQWCIEHRAKVHGHYAPTRHQVDMGGELRVAGMSPDQVDKEMIKRLFEKIEERRTYQKALRASSQN